MKRLMAQLIIKFKNGKTYVHDFKTNQECKDFLYEIDMILNCIEDDGIEQIYTYFIEED